MPTYGDDKVKEMMKSILPSTGRKSARFKKAKVNRAARKAVRTQLSSAPLYSDDDNPVIHDADCTKTRQTRFAVMDRREKDKLNHFQRWASKTAKRWDAERGIADTKQNARKMRGMMPHNTIGDHAMSHLNNLDQFHTGHDWQRYEPPARGYRGNYVPRTTDEDRAALLQRILEIGLHGRFNQYLRNHHTVAYEEKRIPHYTSVAKEPRFVTTEKVAISPKEPRLLLGLHDIEKFLEAYSKEYWRSRGGLETVLLHFRDTGEVPLR